LSSLLIERRDKEKNLLIGELYREIGQLKVELNWLKKTRIYQ